MRIIADFHLHSKYARACSKKLELEIMAAWCQIKGVHVLSCADFTHPLWFKDIQTKLEEALPGLYRLKSEYRTMSEKIAREYIPGPLPEQYFIISTEISCIYSKGGKVCRVHLLLFAPSIEVAAKINERLSRIGNLSADGRPILSIDAKEVARIAFEISPDCFVVPAHAWTPWFAVFGSKSGFDSLEECFDELAPRITAIETGLSSDPEMNWHLSRLNDITLISNSDAHSPEKMGREATVFEGDTLSYNTLIKALQKGASPTSLKVDYTIEFFPEEGMYHVDGHRACKFSCEPQETKRLNGICPVCHRQLTIGVLHRIHDLADQEPQRVRDTMNRYKKIVPLQEIIAQSYGVKSTHSVRVQRMYKELINSYGNEFHILLDCEDEKIFSGMPLGVAQGIRNMRNGNAVVTPGYDGLYGVIHVAHPVKKEQPFLFV